VQTRPAASYALNGVVGVSERSVSTGYLPTSLAKEERAPSDDPIRLSSVGMKQALPGHVTNCCNDAFDPLWSAPGGNSRNTAQNFGSHQSEPVGTSFEIIVFGNRGTK
jgi:hypothetical protein